MKDKVSFKVRKFVNKHTYMKKFDNPIVICNWLAKKYINKFKVDPRWNFPSFCAIVMDNLQIEVVHDSSIRLEGRLRK